jgi:6-phosphogluconate dehydrogenase
MEPLLNKMKTNIISYIQKNGNKITNLQTGLDKLPNLIKNSSNNNQQGTNQLQDSLEAIPNRETLQLIINDNATAIINQFKDFMQDMDIKVSFEVTKAIIRKNFKDLFSELTRIDNYNIDPFY